MVDVWSLLLGWGAGQGALLAGSLLLRRGGNAHAHRLLALLILGFTSLLVEMLVIRNGHFFAYDGFVVPLLTPVTLALGPLYLVYTHSLLGRPRARPSTWHFLPALLTLLNLSPALIGAVRAGFPATPVRLEAAQLLRVSPYLEMTIFIASLLAYALLGLRELRRYELALTDRVSRSSAVHVGWLRVLGRLLLVVTASAALLFSAMLVTREHVVGFEFAMALTFALVIHASGLVTLWRPGVFAASFAAEADVRPEDRVTHSPPAHGAVSSTAATSARSVPSTRYERSGLTAETRAALVAKLRAHMVRERPYLDPELSRGDLATQMNLSPHRLSELLSEGVGVSFFDFVNGYRVDEVKRRLLRGEVERLTILALALESGFASKASFNRVFKRLVGHTPTAWLREQTTGTAETRGEPSSAGVTPSSSRPPA